MSLPTSSFESLAVFMIVQPFESLVVFMIVLSVRCVYLPNWRCHTGLSDITSLKAAEGLNLVPRTSASRVPRMMVCGLATPGQPQPGAIATMAFASRPDAANHRAASQDSRTTNTQHRWVATMHKDSTF